MMTKISIPGIKPSQPDAAAQVEAGTKWSPQITSSLRRNQGSNGSAINLALLTPNPDRPAGQVARNPDISPTPQEI
jgi:hypothetical protein